MQFRRSISRRLAFSILLDKLYEGAFELWVTNGILLKYEEKITDIFSKETARVKQPVSAKKDRIEQRISFFLKNFVLHLAFKNKSTTNELIL